MDPTIPPTTEAAPTARALAPSGGQKRGQRVGQIGERQRLQPDASGAGERGQEDAVAAEEHVTDALNPGDLEVHTALERADVTGMDAQRLAGLQVADHDFSAEFQPCGSEGRRPSGAGIALRNSPDAARMEENRKKALAAALGQIEKQFGKGSVMRLGDAPAIWDVEAVSTGSLGLDIALGIGGLPRGRVVEVFGPESSGKTTLTLQVIAEVQRAGGTAAFVDAEHALDPSYAEKLGVNIERPAGLAARHRRAGAGNHRHAGALRRRRRGGHRLGRGADARRPKSKARWARCRWACRPA